MKKLLNTLYVLTEDAYLSLDGETIAVNVGDQTKNVPLHTLESIVCFSYKGASPALMGKCARDGIALSFFDPRGRYLASVSRPENGNVLLRREQFRIADDEKRSLLIAKSFLTGKLYNGKHVILRAVRDHGLQVDVKRLKETAEKMTAQLQAIQAADSEETLRGAEGVAAQEYFGVFNELILQNKDAFIFTDRNRRPPTDRVNAMLSFSYSILANDCAAALQSVGLDPFVGFLHTDRPGRKSLALDLMEELRAPLADRFVLSIINNRILTADSFRTMENGAVLFRDEAKKAFLSEWQKKKKEELVHPFMEEKMSWGLVPFAQALLLARHVRGDLDQYPPFLKK